MQAALRPTGPAARPAPRLATPSGRAALPPLAAKPTKAADFRSLTDEQIKQEVADGKKALFKLRMAQKTRQVRVGGWERVEIGGGGRPNLAEPPSCVRVCVCVWLRAQAAPMRGGRPVRPPCPPRRWQGWSFDSAVECGRGGDGAGCVLPRRGRTS
jgi:hypothetical protein